MKFATIVLPVIVIGRASAGYCNWNNCNGEVQGGDWCNASEEQCIACGNGSVWCSGAPPSPTPPSPTPPTGGAQIASTTRYWDCSGGACGCSYIPPGQTDPSHCFSNGLFVAPQNNPYGAKFYGTAAISEALGGGDWLAGGCGKCWKVTGLGLNGVASTLVLRGANFCPPQNPACANGNPHFDIAAPGFDVTAYSFAHVCPQLEPAEAQGFAACGSWMIDSPDPKENCDCALFNDPVLRSGCENFLSLQWNNPQVEYEGMSCPEEMVTECGYPYPPPGENPDSCSGSSIPAQPSSSPPTNPPPTNAPPTNAPPTNAPPSNGGGGGGDGYCCSQTFDACMENEYCDADTSHCSNCGGLWMQLPEPGSCIPRYGECTNNAGGCCYPALCKGSYGYKQCGL